MAYSNHVTTVPIRADSRRSFLAGAALALVLGAWLRSHGLGEQLVLDDEWHALHKLMASGYGEIARSFGLADHSIPLTLFYKALAAATGLDEVNLRALQVACGVALVALCAGLAWRVTRDAAVAVMYAFLLAAAPFLVFYSRFARPYAITLAIEVAVLACIWQWRTKRTRKLAGAIALLTGVNAWLHPISAVFPAAALIFVFIEDLAGGARGRKAAARTAALGIACAVAIAALLAAPLWHDFASLAAKAARDPVGAYTLSRVLGIFAGGLPDAATAVAVVIALFGFVRLYGIHARLAAYLLAVCALPVAMFMLLAAHWTHQGHTFARYILPVQCVFLFCVANGALGIVRAVSRRPLPALDMGAALLLGAAYLLATPTIGQVTTLGAWYGHVYHHFDYAGMHNEAARQYLAFEAPAFHYRLAKLPPGSAPLVQAPFTYRAPQNPLAFFGAYHRQPEYAGLLHDLCLDAPREGEVPKDARFRFRRFVFLDDPAAVRASGARYLLLHREINSGKPFRQADRCLAALRALYGEPVHLDARLAAFDLRPSAGGPTLQ